MTGEQAAFGSGLRRERERRDITLATVADSTKIKQSLLAALERGDASHWPGGIYGRAFLREYAVTIGLAQEPVVAEFLRVFPAPGAPVQEAVSRIEAPDGGLRLTLAPERRWFPRANLRQAMAALTDSGVILAMSVAGAMVFGVGFWTAATITAVAYSSLATTVLGRSPILWLIGMAALRRSDMARARVRPRPSSRDLLHIVTPPARQTPAAPLAFDADFTDAIENARAASR